MMAVSPDPEPGLLTPSTMGSLEAPVRPAFRGTALVADGLGFHVPRGYIYAAISFSIGVEALKQLVARRRRTNSPGRLLVANQRSAQRTC
jgi:hypothetical protein